VVDDDGGGRTGNNNAEAGEVYVNACARLDSYTGPLSAQHTLKVHREESVVIDTVEH
jgi:hypothetical protein